MPEHLCAGKKFESMPTRYPDTHMVRVRIAQTAYCAFMCEGNELLDLDRALTSRISVLMNYGAGRHE